MEEREIQEFREPWHYYSPEQPIHDFLGHHISIFGSWLRSLDFLNIGVRVKHGLVVALPEIEKG